MKVQTSDGRKRPPQKLKTAKQNHTASNKPRAPRQNPAVNKQFAKSAQGNINDLLKGFPTVKIAHLKVGDMIAVSSSKSAEPNHLIAIKLLTGVEPFLKTPQVSTSMSKIGGGGNPGGFSIPGLNNGIPNQ